MRCELNRHVARSTKGVRVPITWIARVLAVTPVLLAMGVISACSLADVTSPDKAELIELSPRLNSSAKESGSITVWQDGESFTLDSAVRELRSSSGLRVNLDLELFPQVLSVFQGVLEGDVLGPALESMVQECPEPEMCVDPYRLGDQGAGGSTGGDRVFQSGVYSSRGNGGDLRVILTGRGTTGQRSTDDDVFALSTDPCGDIAGQMLGTITSFRDSRSRWVTELKQVLFDWGVGSAVTAAAIIGIPEGLAIGLGTVGANA